MANENDIRRELKEWESPLSEQSRKTPFEADEAYLSNLTKQLDAYVRNNLNEQRSKSPKRHFHIPSRARGLAAALLLLVSGFAAYQWLRPANPEIALAKELRSLDEGSIETYLDQQSIMNNETGKALAASDQTCKAISVLEPAEIQAYLNQFPSAEFLVN